MSCLIKLRDDLLSGADGGGTWDYLGYSFTIGGTYEVESPTPTFGGFGSDDNPEIDTNGVATGFYKFEYTGGEGVCEDSVEVILQVIEGCHFTEVNDKAYCSGQPFELDLVNITGGCDSSVALDALSDALPTGVELDASGNRKLIADVGATSGSIGDVYIINVDITRTSIPTGGYSEADCLNCNGGDYVVNVTIVEHFEAGTPVLVAACA